MKKRSAECDGTTSTIDASSHEPPVDQSSLPGDLKSNKVSILKKISPFRSRAKLKKKDDCLSPRANDVKTEPKKIVTVKSIYRKHQNAMKNTACKPGQNLTDGDVGNKPSFVVQDPAISHKHSESSQRPSPENQSKNCKAISKCMPGDNSLTIKDTSNSSVPACSLNVSNTECPSTISSFNVGTKLQLGSEQDKINSESLSNNEIIPTNNAKSTTLLSPVVADVVSNLRRRSRPGKAGGESLKKNEIRSAKDGNLINLGSSDDISHTKLPPSAPYSSEVTNRQLRSTQDKPNIHSLPSNEFKTEKDGSSVDLSHANVYPSIPSRNGGSNCHHNLAANKVSRKSIDNDKIITAENEKSIVLETSADCSVEPPLSTSSSTEQFNHFLHSTLKSVPSSPRGPDHSQLLNSREPTPPVSRDNPVLRPPAAKTSPVTHDLPFRRTLQSVTFNTTPDVLNINSSSDDLLESFESSSVASLSSGTTTSTKEDQQLVDSKLDVSQETAVRVRGSQVQTPEKVSNSILSI